MKRYISFILSSKFGFFRKPDFSENISYSYNWIPPTTLYGLLGACLGLTGYESLDGNSKKKLEYMSLKDLIKVAIIPMDKNNNLKFDSFDKDIVVYNTNYHSLQDKRTHLRVSSAQCREQILVNPKFQIILEMDESRIKSKINELKLRDVFFNLLSIEKFLKGPTFTIYLGKNEFLAVITDVREEKTEQIDRTEEFTFSSIFLMNDSYDLSRKWDSSIVNGKYTISEFLPSDYNNNTKYSYNEFFLSNHFIEMKSNNEDVVKIQQSGKQLYVYLV